MPPKSTQQKIDQFCILLLTGLPGCGKTHFANEIIAKCTQYKFIHLCLDEIWTLTCKSKQIEQFDPQAWKAARNTFVDVAKFIMEKRSTIFSNEFTSTLSETFGNWISELSSRFPKSENLSAKVVLILDDNFYYESMRLEFFHLAQKLHLGFLQLSFECDTATCLQRNQSREKTSQTIDVPESVILEMSQKMEKPQLYLPKESFERYLRTQKGSRAKLAFEYFHKPFTVLFTTTSIEKQEEAATSISDVVPMIQFAMENPVENFAALQELEVQQEREATAKHAVHQFDLLLRKTMASFMQSLPKENASSVGKRAHELRKTFFEQNKTRAVAVFETGSLSSLEEDFKKQLAEL